ncbi:GNAT family N-acetyltransferase [Brachybacterium sp. EF45031]|uniref:GNAT family N-acetyltransferase n=1 Tax=Brachybacterium sillae TaxID=2810536 RepID=UPI00217DFDD4|nr:GNAT family N-acetyltransferase [Brachybacterium sillae]MCS6710501.1 GNAT family N-acetyltransferase [Brachybacterium sillae]
MGPDDWRAHRELRLAMLRDAPDAFWTTLADVADRSEEQWREDLTGSRILLQARRGEEILGGVGVLPGPYDREPMPPDTVNIVSMYVRPDARGTGVSRLLLSAAAQVARDLGRPMLQLAVLSDAARARGLYESIGLRPTGLEDPHPRRADATFVEYRAHADELTLPEAPTLHG